MLFLRDIVLQKFYNISSDKLVRNRNLGLLAVAIHI